MTPIGPLVRKSFGPYEHGVAELYRRIFIDLDDLAELMRAWVPQAHSILEVGCGEGAMTERIVKAYPEATVTAIDISPNVGRLFRGDASTVRFRQETVESVASREPASFDLAVLVDVMHHVPAEARESLLFAIDRSLAQTGSLLFKDWAISASPIHWLCDFSDRHLTGDDVSYFTRNGMQTLLTDRFGPGAICRSGFVRPWRKMRLFSFDGRKCINRDVKEIPNGRVPASGGREMPANPFLSVIMPVYNGEKFIAVALESVRTQYRDGIELLVVDDGSQDRTLEIVRDFADALPIRIISPGRIGNWVAATNIGLREATGDWACFLHQDDLWLPGRMERLWGEMENAEGALILHNAVFIGPEGKRLGPWTCPFSDGVLRPDQFTERLLVQNFIASNSPVFRRRAALESGALDETLWFSADWDLWLRLAALGPVRFIDEVLSAFRIHPSSLTASRKVLANEWELQLTTVLDRGLKNWTYAGRRRTSVVRAARVSIAVNSALSAASRGQSPQTLTVLAKLLALGPAGWRRYLRDSRIVQRVVPRLLLQWQPRH